MNAVWSNQTKRKGAFALVLLIRGAAIGIQALTNLMLMGIPHSHKTGASASAVAVLVSCYLVVSRPFSGQIPEPTRLILTIGATLVPVV